MPWFIQVKTVFVVFHSRAKAAQVAICMVTVRRKTLRMVTTDNCNIFPSVHIALLDCVMSANPSLQYALRWTVSAFSKMLPSTAIPSHAQRTVYFH